MPHHQIPDQARLRRLHQAGLTLIEVIVAISIASAATIGVSAMIDRFAQDTKASLVAHKTRVFGEAVKSYIKDNYASVQGAATSTTPAYLSPQMLVATGHLAAGLAPQNAFGQSLCALVLEPAPDRLHALVVSEGGTGIDDLTLGGISMAIGGSGGAIYSSEPATVRGAIGGWDIPTNSFDGLTNDAGLHCDGTPGTVSVLPGRPAMALWFENGDSSSAFLSRDAIPGRPELNQMNTPLVMSSEKTVNDACTKLGAIARNSAGAVVSCQGGVWKAQGSAYWQDAVTNFASLPACNATEANQTRVVKTPTVGVGPRAYTCDGGAWKALSVDDAGNMTLPGILSAGKVQVNDIVVDGTSCSSNGLVAKDSTGLLLSCQSGVWNKLLKVPTGGWRISLSGGYAGKLYTKSSVTLGKGAYLVTYYNCISPSSMSQYYYLQATVEASSGVIGSGWLNMQGDQMSDYSTPPFLLRVFSNQAVVWGSMTMPAGGTFGNTDNDCSGFYFEQIY